MLWNLDREGPEREREFMPIVHLAGPRGIINQ